MTRPNQFEFENMVRVLFFVGIRTNLISELKRGVDWAEQSGYVAQIVDVSMLEREWRGLGNDWESNGLSSYVVHITSLCKLQVLVETGSNGLACFLFLPHRSSLQQIYFLVKRCGYIICQITLAPVPSKSTTFPQRQKFPFFVWYEFSYLIKRGISRIVTFLPRFRKPKIDIWVTAGRTCRTYYSSFFHPFSKAKLISTVSLVGRQWIDYKKHSVIAEKRYLLLLDQGWFSKPPPKYIDQENYPGIDQELYSEKVATLLRKIAQKNDLEIIVAAHPKSNLDHTCGMFPDFQVIKDKTCKLVAESSMVVAHSSTSIQFAILADKPILLITSRQLESGPVDQLQVGYRNELCIPRYSLDNLNLSIPVIPMLDPLLRKRFIDRWIKKPDATVCNYWDQIVP